MIFASTLPLAFLSLAHSVLGADTVTSNTVHVVQVGQNGNLSFYPNDISAAIGDFVEFQFFPSNHTVTQSSFAAPCVPLNGTNPNGGDVFSSGFMPTTSNGNLTYTIQVNTTTPLWFYCAQAKHCQKGMVGSINALKTGNKTLADFTKLAASAPNTTSLPKSAGVLGHLIAGAADLSGEEPDTSGGTTVGILKIGSMVLPLLATAVGTALCW